MTLNDLNDLERRNSLYFAFSSLNSIAFLANYVTVVEYRPRMSPKYCLPVSVFHFWPKLTHPAALSLCGYDDFMIQKYIDPIFLPWRFCGEELNGH